ncbi:MAG: short-chain dehydrogenase/reductase [Ilumatobacteraceae bacterium]|nr:short-chain dehydrogenase/reductase [Ilumatobacteraceae bacterium]
MAYQLSDIPDLTGRVAVVTGANGGLGLETAKALAGAGAHVVIAARDQAKAGAAEAIIRAEHPTASLAIVELDLGSLESVATAAAAVLADHDRIDLLVNNAGLMALPERTTVDGFEMQLGVNHFGHWALTGRLMPAILHADAGRVVTVTSTAHHMGRAIDPQNPNLSGKYSPWKAYGQSKLANYHFAIGLQQRFDAAGLATASLLAHPGLSDTGLQAHTVAEGGAGFSGRMAERLTHLTGMSAARGAMPQIRAATDPEARGGQFYAPRFVNNGAAVRRPVLRRIGMARAIATLWDLSARSTGIAIDPAAAGDTVSR